MNLKIFQSRWKENQSQWKENPSFFLLPNEPIQGVALQNLFLPLFSSKFMTEFSCNTGAASDAATFVTPQSDERDGDK